MLNNNKKLYNNILNILSLAFSSFSQNKYSHNYVISLID